MGLAPGAIEFSIKKLQLSRKTRAKFSTLEVAVCALMQPNLELKT